MPSLGADMDAGTLLEWLKSSRATRVKRGDIVAVVDTDKAEIEVEIFADGVIDELLVPPRAHACPSGPRWRPLLPAAARGSPGRRAQCASAPPADGRAAATAAPSPAARRPPQRAAARSPPRGAPRAARRRSRPPVQPAADRTARSRGPTWSAPRRDRAAGTDRPPQHARPARPPPSPPDAAPTAQRRPMREAIGALMARSKREIPHYYLQLEIDMSAALDWLHEANLDRPVEERLLPSALLLSAVALAVGEMPELNGFWVDGAFVPGRASTSASRSRCAAAA